MLPRPAALGLARALVPAAALVALLAGIAFASAGDDAASKAKNTLSELEAKRNAPPTASSLASGDAGASSDGALAPKRSSAVAAADDAIAEANRALKRAQELRANADVPRAELAEDLALEWALTARETVAAVEGEREADDLAVGAVEATTKADRAHAPRRSDHETRQAPGEARRARRRAGAKSARCRARRQEERGREVSRSAAFALLVGLTLATTGCPRNPRPLVFGRIDQERGAPLVVRAKEESPALFAKAEGLRAKAEQAWEAGDTASAELYGDHALAAYRHAVATGRLAAANARRAREAERLTKASDRLTADEKSLAEVDREADKLEGEIAVRREALTPAVSGPTSAAREAARWIATKVNLATAEALCEGANLLAPSAKGGAEARKVLAELNAQVSKGDKVEAPIDASTRARALCLKALTHARDATVAGGGPSGDALFAEISGMGGYEPLRDERGVVATLSQIPATTAPFEAGSGKLTKSGKDRIEALGRVAKTHPTFAILVVVHAAPGGGNTSARDKERALLVKQTLAAAGAPLDRIGTQMPGSQLPAYDPTDAKVKARNERIEIIFVGGTK